MMETPAQMCLRLIAALEDLADQEEASLLARDFESVLKLQDRSAPLVAKLAQQGAEVTDEQLRQRIFEWFARRGRTGDRLSGMIADARADLKAVDASRRRAARVVPAYVTGTQDRSPKHLSAIG